MYPKELKSGLISNVLFRLFIDLVSELEKTDNFIKNDENEQNHIKDGASHLYDASRIEEKIRKMWGQNQDLLSGLFVYLHSGDNYFNPKFNTKDLFFRKIFTFNVDILEKIGKGIIKPAFPFVNYDNHKKRILLIR